MRRKRLAIAVILFSVIFVTSAYSDFGSFSGKSDYSSSRSSSSSSRSSSSSSRSSSSSSSSRSYSSGTTTSTRRSSSSSSTLGSNLTVPLMAGAVASRRSSSNSDSEMSDEEFSECAGVAFVFLIFALFWFLSHKKRSPRQIQDPVIINTHQPIINLREMSEYLELDPNFDEERIKTLMGNLYVQMQETWQAKDISPIRPYMTDKFYNQMNKQLEEFRKYHRTDHTERIAVLNVDLVGWRQSAGMDYITVSLSSRIVSYVVDDLTDKVISGDKDKEKFMEYEIDLTRKSGEFTTPETEGTKSATCPHCGAPININASAKCEYCGSIITSVNTDWAICAMRGISQRTV